MITWLTGCASILEKYNTPVDPEDTTMMLVTIPKGASTTSIATILKEADLIQNINAFKAKTKLLEVDGKMQAGDYQLSKAMSTEDIIDKLVSGDTYVETFTFTIPEGYEVRQIVDKLTSEGYVDADAFKTVLAEGDFDFAFLEGVDRSYLLEGYLFPDTYTFKKGASETEIVTRMLERFDEIFKAEYYAQAQAMDMSVDQVVTLASIIERETIKKEELPIVSSVFHNRIEIGMPLQSCASVQYILMERKERLTYDDIAIQSPFNTYLHLGLTPAPIASPGQDAIIAALYPAETDYLYFVATYAGDGSHYFNETLAGHNRDKEKSKAAENGN